MNKKIIKFDDTEIKEYKFHQYKSHISIKDIDINEIVVSNKFRFGKQDFTQFIPKIIKKYILCIFFPEMSIYQVYSNKTKCMYFMIKHEKKLIKQPSNFSIFCHGK